MEKKLKLHDGAVGVIPSQEEAANDFADWPDGRIDHVFAEAPPALQFFARDRLLANRGHAVAGIGGSSKTRLLYHLAVGAVLGRVPWDWQIERTGRAALFLTEDTAADVHRMLHALGETLAPSDREKLIDGLRVFPLAGLSARLLIRGGASLTEGPAYDWCMERLSGLKECVFFGLDPALAITEGDELDQAHQRRLGEVVDRMAIKIDACGMLTTHAAKSSQTLDEPGSHTSRGGGALTDALRGEYTLRTMTPDEGKRFRVGDITERKRHVQLVAVKGNWLPPEAYAPVWLRRGEHGLLHVAEIDLDAGSRAASEIGTKEREILRVLLTLTMEKSGSSVALEAWRKRAVATGALKTHSKDPGAVEQAMGRAVKALIEGGVVRKDEGKRGRYIAEDDAASIFGIE